MSDKKLALLFMSLLLLIPSVFSDGSDYKGPTEDDTQVLNLINEYRRTIANVSLLGYNKGAACVAHGVALRFKDITCTNETGADTDFGENPQIPDYLQLLKDCGVSLENVKDGYLASDCVPPGAGAAVAAMNITLDQEYQTALNDSVYKTGGVGSSGSWYVLVLATDEPEGNFGTSADLGGGGSGGPKALRMSLFTFSVMLVLSVFSALHGRLI